MLPRVAETEEVREMFVEKTQTKDEIKQKYEKQQREYEEFMRIKEQ